MNTYSSFPYKDFHAHTSSNPEENTHTLMQEQHTQIQCYVTHTHTFPLTLLDPPPPLTETFTHAHTRTLIQAPHLPQFAEQTVRRSTPLWGSFSRARDMKSQLNSYAVAC